MTYPINSIINEKYITWLEKVELINNLHTRDLYLRKWVNDQRFNIQKQKKMKK